MTEADPRASGVIDADIVDTLHRLSLRYYSHGLYEDSARLMEFLLRHEPARAGFHYALAKALHAQARHDKALHSYRRAVRLGLPDLDAHLYMGQCLIFLRQFPLAALALQHFIGLAQAQAQARDRAPVDAALFQRARHLLERVVLPHLPAAGPTAAAPNSRPASAPATPARRQAHDPLEISR